MTAQSDAQRQANDDMRGVLEGDEPDWSVTEDNWTPPDLRTADGILRRHRRIVHEAMMLDAAYAREIADMQALRADHVGRVGAQAARLELALRLFLEARIMENGGWSVTLPSGKLTAALAPPQFEYDEAAFMAWATATVPDADLVRQPPPPAKAPDKNAVKAWVAANCVIGPDHTVTMRGDTDEGVPVAGLTVAPGGTLTRYPDRKLQIK